MRKAFKFTLVVVALLTLPWLTSIAYGRSDNCPAPGAVRVEVADRTAAPAATFFGCASGSISPRDLFYVDATGSPRDLVVSLYITNAPELTRYLKYLILKVSVCSKSEDSRWQPTSSISRSAPESSGYLTLRNGLVRFNLCGNARYKISIDSGSYYCLPASTGSSNEPPIFYLAVEPD